MTGPEDRVFVAIACFNVGHLWLIRVERP